MEEKKIRRLQFPRNFLSFPELKITRKKGKQSKKKQPFLQGVWVLLVAGAMSLVVLVFLLFIALDIAHHLKEKQDLEKKRQSLSQQVAYWQLVVAKHQDYRDAYLKLATLAYQLKDFKKAKEYTEKSLVLDPNYEAGRAMEKLLSGK